MEKTAPDGTKHGDPIPISTLFRAFCHYCGEPMRVTEKALSDEEKHCCTDCEGLNPTSAMSLTKRQRHGKGHMS
jgi:hypothetical protein